MGVPKHDPLMISPIVLPNLEGKIKTQIERVLREMDKTHHATYEDDLDSPFIAKVLDASIPLLLNSPQIPLYDGRTNPNTHLRLLMDAMVTRGIDNSHMCHLLLAMLKGATSSWFHSFPPNSIINFWLFIGNSFLGSRKVLSCAKRLVTYSHSDNMI